MVYLICFNMQYICLANDVKIKKKDLFNEVRCAVGIIQYWLNDIVQYDVSAERDLNH